MLAELITYVKETLKLEVDIYCYSDSTITLRWIAAEPRRWKTFVGNRVALIQELVPVEAWHHISGIDNPADLASRGCSVEEILNGGLWNQGAALLMLKQLPQYPVPQNVELDMEERKENDESVKVNVVKVEECTILTSFSSFKRLKRATAWRLRWLLFKVGRVRNGPLSAAELDASSLLWIRRVQRQHFGKDIAALEKDGHVGVKSNVRSLVPFLDRNRIMRVSGRLENSALSESRKHQIILPAWSHFTTLIIDHQHQRVFHGGFQVTLSTLQTEYWILHARSVVRGFIRRCMRCQKFKKSVAEQLMGNLPSARITPSRCFEETGLDFAGPFTLKNPIGRVPKTYKGYLVIFVCLATKAVHLEAASGLSTEDFLAVLRRFVSIRGLCRKLYSDNGTNFVGAEREIWRILNKETREKAAAELAESSIDWDFNPPAAPHRGGLWEAGVKSAKYHLRRVVGNAVLTFEQFLTILMQISAVLNSRPLYPRSSDPADLEPLTPGHFLIGGPLIALPDRDVETVPINRLSLYQRQQQRLQQFWRRWSREYLNTLQQRNKWVWDQPNLEEGRLVMLAEETAPGNWRMGRVTKVYPGGDGRVRVVDVKTAKGPLQRPITKLVPLLCGEEMEGHRSGTH